MLLNSMDITLNKPLENKIKYRLNKTSSKEGEVEKGEEGKLG